MKRNFHDTTNDDDTTTTTTTTMYPSGTPLILRNDLFLDRRDGTEWNVIVFIRS